MPSNKTKLSTVSFLLLASLCLPSSLVRAEQEAAPVPVSQWKPSDAPVVENPDEMSLEDVVSYLEEKHEAEDQDDQDEAARIAFNPAQGAGKIIIRVHKSANPKKGPEYLEVFRQRSADAKDLEPVNLFDGGSTNTALVSTAGTYGKKVYSTPVGTFNIDSMEKMHHSSKYNNAPMPWSMFFNGGIAIHGATPGEFGDLGRKASHGCVRVHPANAKLIFDLIRANGGRSGAVVEVLAS